MFATAERRILGITLRGEKRKFDPLRVRREMLRQTGGELFRLWKEMDRVAQSIAQGESVPVESLDAEEVMLGAARVAFGLELDGTESEEGYTDAEVKDVTNQWSRWLAKKDDRGESLPTGSAPSAVSPESESVSAANGEASPTPAMSPSTSTSAEFDSSVPGQ